MKSNEDAMISIKDIAKNLHIRQDRIFNKVEKMNLTISYQEDVPFLDKDNIRLLVQAYLHSKKVNDNTRANAKRFLNMLDEKEKGDDVIKKIRIQKGRMDSKQNIKKYVASKKSNSVLKRCTIIVQSIKLILKASVRSFESLYFKFIALFVAIGVQMHHSAVWFYRSSPEGTASWPSAVGFAIMYDLFILVVTMEGRTQLAKGFSVLTFFSNLLYFEPWIGFDGTVQHWTKAVSSIMISAIIAFILYAYTEIFVKYKSVQTLSE